MSRQINRAPIAQLVEHLICNQRVGSSSLSGGTIFLFLSYYIQGIRSFLGSPFHLLFHLEKSIESVGDGSLASRDVQIEQKETG